MKILVSILALVIVILGVLGLRNSYPVFYDKNGQINANQIKIWGDTVTPTTANGYSIDISSAGLSVLKSVTVTPQFNTATIGSMPIVVIKSQSPTAIVVNILTQNSATITILGISVLSGAPLQFASSLSGMTLNVQAGGY